MSNIFQELARLRLRDEKTTYEQDRQLLNNLVSFMRTLDWQDDYTEWFANLRQFKKETIIKADGFMCDEDFPIHELPEEFQADRLGFCYKMRMVYWGFFVFPVKDIKGNVAGFVGYNATHIEDGTAKYLDSRTIGYNAKETMLYGMEKMEEYYRDGYVFVPEGLMCTNWLRENEINSVASLGSNHSPYVTEILKRFGRNCIIILDNDETGFKFGRSLRYSLPNARKIFMNHAKDADDERKIREDLAHELKSYVRMPYKRYNCFTPF